MTYMPSTHSGVSDTDQSPDISQEFLDEEKKSKKHMKKLAKLLKKTAKEQDALDVKVRFLKLTGRLRGMPLKLSLISIRHHVRVSQSY